MKKINLYAKLLLFSLLITLIDGFIVPQEVPSLLSLVYSNIPPIKKGTDSRIGFGYRFGDHADIQVQFEIGPQKETQPIGTAASQSKRNIRPSDELYVQKTVRREQIKKQEEAPKGSSWLENWFNQLRHEKTTKTPQVTKLPMISGTALHQLQKLYEKTDVEVDSAEESTSTEHNNEASAVNLSLISDTTMSHHLSPAALAILKGNRSQQQSGSAAKSEDLANVDLE